MERKRVTASSEMKIGFGFKKMENPKSVREWFEGLFERHPFNPEAINFFRTLRFEIGDFSQPGGGFWWADKRLVQLRGAQDEAGLHELSHAFWHQKREEGGNADKLMDAVVRLSGETDERYKKTATLAHHYVYGIPTQPDPNSPTGYWRGMLVEGNDWEMFAGLASGTMGDMSQLPKYIHPFYQDLFQVAAEVDEEKQQREQLYGIDPTTIIARHTLVDKYLSPRKFIFAIGKDKKTIYEYSNRASEFVVEAGTVCCGGNQPPLSWITPDIIFENIAVYEGRRKINIDLVKKVYDAAVEIDPEWPKLWVLGPAVEIDNKSGEIREIDHDMGLWGRFDTRFDNKGVKIVYEESDRELQAINIP